MSRTRPLAALLLISVFKNLAPVVWIAEAVGIIYLIASVLMFVDSKRNRSAKKMLIGILLAMIPLFILLLLLTTSVNVTYN
jgi:glycerol uptake facilitator-like aquaporin